MYVLCICVWCMWCIYVIYVYMWCMYVMYVCMWYVCDEYMHVCIMHMCMIYVCSVYMWCMYICGVCMYVMYVCMWCMWCMYACVYYTHTYNLLFLVVTQVQTTNKIAHTRVFTVLPFQLWLNGNSLRKHYSSKFYFLFSSQTTILEGIHSCYFIWTRTEICGVDRICLL